MKTIQMRWADEMQWHDVRTLSPDENPEEALRLERVAFVAARRIYISACEAEFRLKP
jgi:hypothetical protein